MQQLATLELKFGSNPRLQQTKTESEWHQEVSDWITQISTDNRHKAVTKRRSLSCYASHKLVPAPNLITEETNRVHYCSKLAQVLWRLNNDAMNSFLDSDPTCHLCGAAEETITHVLQACPHLHNVPRTSPSLPELLGLSGQTDKTHFNRVNSTKTLLLRWDRLNRGAENTPARETPPHTLLFFNPAHRLTIGRFR
ncbi:hypothetical protein MRX96_013891 [Rhipicephalus microplus]